MTRLIRLLPLVWLILTACFVSSSKWLSKSLNSPQWYQRQLDVLHLSYYQTCGAFIYFSHQQKIYARFFWQRTGQGSYRLLVLNPLGSIELDLNSKPGKTQITNYKGQYYTVATNTEQIIYELTGILIPFNNLCQWILGLPGDATDYKLDNQYRLSELNYIQNEKTWKVVYGSYNTKTTPAMPSSIELEEGGRHIKLKMDKWIVK